VGASGFSGMEWRTGMVEWNSGMVEWNGMVLSWILLIGFTSISTTSEQRPPVNKDHPN